MGGDRIADPICEAWRAATQHSYARYGGSDPVHRLGRLPVADTATAFDVIGGAPTICLASHCDPILALPRKLWAGSSLKGAVPAI